MVPIGMEGGNAGVHVLGFGTWHSQVREPVLSRVVFVCVCVRGSGSEAVRKAASRGCGNMYSEECSDVAGSKEVHRDEGCCREDTSWIPGNGSSQGVPITKADESCHPHSGIGSVRVRGIGRMLCFCRWE